VEPQDYDWPNGCCPKCDCEVGMDVQEIPVNIIRYICPSCGYFEDFDDSPFDVDPALLLPPYTPTTARDVKIAAEILRM
jgi:hypothetical protein